MTKPASVGYETDRFFVSVFSQIGNHTPIKVDDDVCVRRQTCILNVQGI